MRKIITKLIGIAGIYLCCIGSSFADQNDIRLDNLFVELAKPDQPYPVYHMLEGEIWEIWGQAPENDVQNLMNLGHQSMRMGLLENALEQYKKATHLAPDYAEGWNKQATTLYMMARFSEAIAAVNKTLELEPRHFGALSGLGLIYEAFGEEKGARAAYTKALSYNPHMGRIQSRLDYLKSISEEADI